MTPFQGIIIEESLVDKSILKKLKILSTEVEKVTTEHATPWIKNWTMHTVEILESDVEDVINKISSALDSTRCNWYADIKNEKYHYIIFKEKVFKVNRLRPDGYQKVVKYGMNLGIPLHQLDFSPDIKK